jgi:hypothetical protein
VDLNKKSSRKNILDVFWVIEIIFKLVKEDLIKEKTILYERKDAL